MSETTAGIAAAALALYKAVRSFEAADTELRRADWAGTQPRMQRAGNRHATAKSKMFTAARSYANERR